MVDFMPQYGSVIASISEDSTVSHPKTANTKPSTQYVPAVCGAYSLLQVPSTSIPTSLAVPKLSLLSPAPMDIYKDSISTASVVVSQVPITHPFFQSFKGKA
jgi:hypothetical protein